MKNLIYRIKNLTKVGAVKEATLYSFANAINQILSFASAIFVVRYLGPVNVGLMAFAQNYLLIFLTILSGADYYFSWSLGREKDKLEIIKNYILHRTFLGILLTVCGIFCAYLFLPSDIFTLILVLFAPLALNTLNIFSLYAVYEKRARLYFFASVVWAALLFVLKLLFVYLKLDLIYFVTLIGLDIFFGGLVYFLYYLKKDTNIKKALIEALYSLREYSPKKSIIFFNGLKMAILASFMWQLLLRFDQFVLSFMSKFGYLKNLSGAYNLGIYSSAVKISEIPNSLAIIIYMILFSRMNHYIGQNNNSLTKKILAIYISCGLVFTIFIFIFAEPIVKIIYGSKFLESIPVLRVYCLSIVSVYIIYFYFALYGAKQKYKEQVVAFSIGVFLNLVFIFIFSQSLGILGVALSTVIAYGFVALYLYFHNKNFTNKVL